MMADVTLYVGKHEDTSEGDKWFVRRDGQTANDPELYVSRSPLKTLVKAPLLAADLSANDVVISVSPEAATAAGKANLELMADAARFVTVAEFVNTQVPTDMIIETLKAQQPQFS